MEQLPPASGNETDYCEGCPLSSQPYVPGEGYSDCPCLVVGTAPGAHEEASLKPFTGPGGRMVREIFAGLGVTDRMYLTNVLKRRPLSASGRQRKPSKHECWKCGSHLMTEIAQHQPKVVITMGQSPLEFFMGAMKVSQVHGLPLRLTKWQLEMIVIPAFDPSHILRRGGLNSETGDQFLSDLEDAVGEMERRNV